MFWSATTILPCASKRNCAGLLVWLVVDPFVPPPTTIAFVVPLAKYLILLCPPSQTYKFPCASTSKPRGKLKLLIKLLATPLPAIDAPIVAPFAQLVTLFPSYSKIVILPLASTITSLGLDNWFANLPMPLPPATTVPPVAPIVQRKILCLFQSAINILLPCTKTLCGFVNRLFVLPEKPVVPATVTPTPVQTRWLLLIKVPFLNHWILVMLAALAPPTIIVCGLLQGLLILDKVTFGTSFTEIITTWCLVKQLSLLIIVVRKVSFWV